MAKTLAQLQRQIAKLQRQADVLKKKEVGGVIERIQTAIEHYGLTAQHLFGIKARKAAPSKRAKGAGKKAATKKAVAKKALAKKALSRRPPVPVKYRDAEGNAWTGRGSQPRWLAAALKSGKKVEDFAVKS